MIQVENLSRTFKSKKEVVRAVDDISFSVAQGELVALLGPNGAGKSTTLRMLTTLLPPTAGRATLNGLDVVRDSVAVRKQIGFVSQGNAAGHHFRVDDELVSQGLFHGLKLHEAAARARELLATLELESLATRTTSTLSGGQRRRLDIAMGLMNRPPVLFLDEPTTGMDPQNRANLWDHILRLRAESSTTIVLTTHYLEEADNMAERVLIIDHGRIIADDTAETLKQELGGDTITIQVARDLGDAAAAHLGGAERDDGPETTTFRLRTERADRRLPALLTTLAGSGVEVSGVSMRQPTLDDVFLERTGRSLREGPEHE